MTTLVPTAAPIRPFLDWPVVTNPADWTTEVALLGIQHSEPYAGDPWPNDQARAPDAVRLVSAQISYGPDQWDFDVGAPLSALRPACLDAGNVAWVDRSYDEYAAAITARLRHLWRQGTQVFIVGGDHGVTIPVIDALDAVGEPVYIVHIDAHLDWRAEVNGVTRGYSSPLRWASRKPWISGMTQIGMRATGSARRGELEDAGNYGSHIFAAKDVHAGGFEPVLATIPAKSAVYVTIDADGMDPTEMPGVMAPAPGGLRYEQVAPFLRTIAQRQRIVGLDVVEIAPRFDSANGITCIMAGRLIVNALGASWGPTGAYRTPRGG
ncbi:MAG TPA: arginase family protein [Steroidobacteraceae bacterium]|jgi:agmatinase|nr:arginase family protein [Steroidobacteraceae bacterium]